MIEDVERHVGLDAALIVRIILERSASRDQLIEPALPSAGKPKIVELIPDWKAREKGSEAAALLLPADGRHKGKKAALAPGLKPQRLLCFRLPNETDELGGIFASVNLPAND